MSRGLPNSHPFLHIRGCEIFVEIDHKLGKLFDVNHILRVFRVCVNNLSTSSNLVERQTNYYVMF